MQLADGEAVCLKGMMLGMAASAAARVDDGTSGASGCGMTGAAGVVCDGSVADGAVEGCVEAGAVALGSVFVLWNVQDSLIVDYVAGRGTRPERQASSPRNAAISAVAARLVHSLAGLSPSKLAL